MAELFDNYDESFGAVVQSSIDFSGLPHSFFMQAKADMLRDIVAKRMSGIKPAALDVGCGNGIFHPVVRNVFKTLSGADVSAASIDKARRSNDGIDYRAYAGHMLPYDGAEFDFAFTVCVMHHVPPQQWLGFMREMRRVVRPGGLICVIEHNPFNPLTRLAVSRCEFDSDAVLLRAGRTRRLMIDAGLHAVDTQYFLLLPRATPAARRIEHGLRRLPLGAQYVTCGVA